MNQMNRICFIVIGAMLLPLQTVHAGQEIDLQKAIKESFAFREHLLDQGFWCAFSMKEQNRAWKSEADVQVWQKRTNVKMVFDYLSTTEILELPKTPRREVSVNGDKYMEADLFTSQGIIGSAQNSQERIFRNIICPTQFWLDYRDKPLSSYLEGAVYDASDVSVRLVFSYGELRLEFAPEWKFLVKKAQFFEKGGILMREFIVSKAEDALSGGGLFVPQQFSSEMLAPGLDGKAQPINKTEWRLKRFKPHEELGQNQLEIDFPKGTSVADNVNGKNFRVGFPEQHNPNGIVREPTEGHDRILTRTVYVLLAVFALTLLSYLLWLRAARRRSSE
jgi:hypothetical protein